MCWLQRDLIISTRTTAGLCFGGTSQGYKSWVKIKDKDLNIFQADVSLMSMQWGDASFYSLWGWDIWVKYQSPAAFWMHICNGRLTYFQYDDARPQSPHENDEQLFSWIWKKSHNIKLSDCVSKGDSESSVQWDENAPCIFKLCLIAFLICQMKFTFRVFSLVSAHATPKWPGDYSEEKGYFITFGS